MPSAVDQLSASWFEQDEFTRLAVSPLFVSDLAKRVRNRIAFWRIIQDALYDDGRYEDAHLIRRHDPLTYWPCDDGAGHWYWPSRDRNDAGCCMWAFSGSAFTMMPDSLYDRESKRLRHFDNIVEALLAHHRELEAVFEL